MAKQGGLSSLREMVDEGLSVRDISHFSPPDNRQRNNRCQPLRKRVFRLGHGQHGNGNQSRHEIVSVTTRVDR